MLITQPSAAGSGLIDSPCIVHGTATAGVNVAACRPARGHPSWRIWYSLDYLLYCWSSPLSVL